VADPRARCRGQRATLSSIDATRAHERVQE
jgi:hypothetical protein